MGVFPLGAASQRRWASDPYRADASTMKRWKGSHEHVRRRLAGSFGQIGPRWCLRDGRGQ